MRYRQMLEQINSDYTAYSQTQLDAIREMIENNPIIKDWETDNLAA